MERKERRHHTREFKLEAVRYLDLIRRHGIRQSMTAVRG